MAWICSTCGQNHEDVPLSFAADFPDNFANMSADERDARALITSDQCIIDEKEFYVRGLIEIPIHGEPDPFLWGVWASVSEEDFDQIHDSWQLKGRESTTGPFKGRLANGFGPYTPTTRNLKLTIKIRPVGERPLFFLDEADHPLGTTQRCGLTLSEAQEIASFVLHD
ncbi:hypothetical protein SAMN05421819_1680 [Bryocella elongata]|uniref:DUF2199 domain-containing protein n=1 Tax=Bryocella elongata TaxID=863522 RepID=A0A1H5WQI8_9BACT|nr:DUF2199 domain-containing protein [Bryocella elongata]SEG01227.1 hypothetical protein SAMN05421819_1680 [Bryocella elongata]